MLKWMAYKLIVKTVAWSFFFFISSLIGKLWMKDIINFRLIAWKCLPFKNEKIWNQSKKQKLIQNSIQLLIKIKI